VKFELHAETAHARVPGRLSAFSLVELLIVIAIIGILSAIAIPGVSQLSEASREAANKRNAQSIALVASAARTAGATNVWTNVNDALRDICSDTGISVSNGNYSMPLIFRIDSVSAQDQSNALPYLQFDGSALGGIRYIPNASGS